MEVFMDKTTPDHIDRTQAPEGSIPEEVSIRIIRSSRRTLSLQVRRGGEVIVRAPLHASLHEINAFIQKNRSWLAQHLAAVQKEKEEEDQHPVQPLTMEEIRSLADEAMRVLPARVSHFASLVGVTYGRITIRNQKTRWGSCSSKGNLNFNCLLMLAPAAVQDYVVVHELCHRKEMNHSPRFWAEVERIIPEYKTYEKWLKTEGKHLMRRMTG